MRKTGGVAPALAAVAASVAFGGCHEATAPVAADAVDCRFSPPAPLVAECRHVAAPAFRGGDPGGEVLLAVATISSGPAAAERPPVVLIEGGPGGPVFEASWPEADFMPFWFDTIGPLVRERDVVLFDQRGVGLSVPNMNCPEIDRLARTAEGPRGSDPAHAIREFEALDACARRLRAEGVDPAMLSTPATARDVVAILDDLGHDKADVWAFSYGTKVALVLLANHGDRIGRVLLDGVYPPHIAISAQAPATTALAFGRLFQACRDDPACAEAFPGLRERFEAEIERLNARPRDIRMTLSDRWNEAQAFRIDGDAVILGIYDALYSTASIPRIPRLVRDAVDGDPSAFSAFLEFSHYGDWGLDEGVNAVLWCREELPFLDEEKLWVEARKHGVYGRPWRLLGDPAWCAPWDVPPADPGERSPVRSDHTVLLVSGRFDPVTPDVFAEAAAARLPNSRHLVFEGAGHAPTATEPCGADLAARFFASPNPLDVEPRNCPVFESPPDFVVDP